MKKQITTLLLAIAVLSIPLAAHAYTVQPGDTMWQIAQDAGVKLSDLIMMNQHIDDPNLIRVGEEIDLGQEELLGATNPVAGATYYLSGSGVTASAGSITVQSLSIPQTGRLLQDSDFSDTFYITLEPGSTKKQEIASCTTVAQNGNGTATLSGCTRGLLPFTPYTASSTYRFAHAGGTAVIFSDPPQLFNEYAEVANTNTISGLWTYTNNKGACFNTSDYCIRSTGSALQWSDDGFVSSIYDFTSSSISTLTASTTAGIEVISSEIAVNVSTTRGLAFDATTGELYQKVSSTSGVASDSEGIYLVTSTVADNLLVSTTASSGGIPKADGTGKIDTGFLVAPFVTNTASTSTGAFNTEYQNTTSNTIVVIYTIRISACGGISSDQETVSLFLGPTSGALNDFGSVVLCGQSTSSGSNPSFAMGMFLPVVVPPNWYYRVTSVGSIPTSIDLVGSYPLSTTY